MRTFIIFTRNGLIKVEADYIFFSMGMTHLAVRSGEGDEEEEVIVGIVPIKCIVLEDKNITTSKQEDESTTP